MNDNIEVDCLGIAVDIQSLVRGVRISSLRSHCSSLERSGCHGRYSSHMTVSSAGNVYRETLPFIQTIVALVIRHELDVNEDIEVVTSISSVLTCSLSSRIMIAYANLIGQR
jgi:hypothetical protein